LSTATKPPPPIRIRRRTVTIKAPESPPVATPPPSEPVPQAKPLQALAQLVAALEKPKGPARQPRKHRPLVRVENPRRLRRGSKDHRKLGGMIITGKAWGSPFRCRQIDGRWSVVWVGDEMGLGEYKPASWTDIPCQDRKEAAQLCQVVFQNWITSKSSAKLLEHARTILRGLNLACHCPVGYPCHGDVLLEVANHE